MGVDGSDESSLGRVVPQGLYAPSGRAGTNGDKSARAGPDLADPRGVVRRRDRTLYQRDVIGTIDDSA